MEPATNTTPTAPDNSTTAAPTTLTAATTNSTEDAPTCLTFSLWCIGTFIIAMAIGVLSYIVLMKPFTDQTIEFEIKSLSVSPFTVYSSSLTANWNINFLFTNHYKDKTIYYDVVQVSVFYNKEFLSMSTVVSNQTALYQSPKNQTLVLATVAASSVFVSHEVAAAMVADLKYESLGFNVQVQGVVMVGGGVHARRMLLRTDCHSIKVGISNSNGALFGGSSKCDVEVD